MSAPDGGLTYAELAQRADRVARALRDAGARELVGLCVERSASLIVGALGCFRAGLAYVAMDPQYPDERLDWMLEDAGAVAVVTDPATAPRLKRAHRIVLEPGGVLTDPSEDAVADLEARGELAYVVYTSGSTGRPKGVMVDHGALANLVQWHRDAFSLTAADRTTQIASPGFDAAVWEIWPSLAAGAAIHVVPDALRNDPALLRDWLVAEGITVSFVPTPLAEGLIALEWPEACDLRYLLTGGDALTRRPRPGLGFTLVNNYGPSETAVVATSGAVSAFGAAPPSIGRPIRGVEVEIVNSQLRPVAAGEAGELLLGGVALARGYLNRPDLTSERFVLNGHGRRYRTGDRVRLRPDGELEFLGRLDDQLSIRGFRIEPGEIVHTLTSHPAIDAAAVVGSGEGSERLLIAYVVCAGARRPDDAELARFLACSLPEYMIPTRYVWLEHLPLTAHGKVDRGALPGGRGAVSTGTTEEVIVSIIAGLLVVDDVAANENFFLLGGHSLLGAQLIARLEERFGVELSLRYLFDHPTAAQVAAEVDRQLATRLDVDLVAG